MDKGFLRRLAGSPAWVLVLAGLLHGQVQPPARSGESPAGGTASWTVRLTVAAKGEYVVRGAETPISGEYTCRAGWEGRLEPDGDDFLLVHIKTEILEWRLREKTGPAGHESVAEAPASPQPALRLSYVLRDGRDVEFFFELSGISIPLRASPLALVLELPRSSGRTPGPPGQGYGDFVCRGSSRVAVPETDFLQRIPKRTFSWDWRRERRVVKKDRIYVVAQSHTAEAVIALAAR
jgi:hypothetical protein